MKTEIATTQGAKLAAAFKKVGLQANADDEGVSVTTRTPADRKKVVTILTKHGMDKTDISDGYPELLEAEQLDEESETDFDFTVNEDGSLTLAFGDTEYDIEASDVAEIIEACGSRKEKKVEESTTPVVGTLSFEQFLAEKSVSGPVKKNESGELDEFLPG